MLGKKKKKKSPYDYQVVDIDFAPCIILGHLSAGWPSIKSLFLLVFAAVPAVASCMLTATSLRLSPLSRQEPLNCSKLQSEERMKE